MLYYFQRYFQRATGLSRDPSIVESYVEPIALKDLPIKNNGPLSAKLWRIQYLVTLWGKQSSTVNN
jgi:hypothetical protein